MDSARRPGTADPVRIGTVQFGRRCSWSCGARVGRASIFSRAGLRWRTVR